jgi:hypothetical protein
LYTHWALEPNLIFPDVRDKDHNNMIGLMDDLIDFSKDSLGNFLCQLRI